ncbi:DUF3737 family protein [Reinekea blandensis]|uniref:DUF3737 family protein n=1 Tax=Reinekea blandensis MED297 TaxID=314283 RepID=A4BDU5_9GAMM|nr:DUF3737 family protein [Reinekea blandensis]EAR09704.1 hypothetical protein MED297_16134 [Reinekea blandensis MED297]
MDIIKGQAFEGERPLFSIKNRRIENVRIGLGESSLKHASHVSAHDCDFHGKYPFWHGDDIKITESVFRETARAAIWYTNALVMSSCHVQAPKMFRRVSDLSIENCSFLNAEETLWNCRSVVLDNSEFLNADYILMNIVDAELNNCKIQGNYSFQDGKNIVIRNSIIESKDAFWGTENVTVYDSVIDGEFLGWYSKNLKLINCTIRGSQPLYYAENLQLENCRMEGTDLCFEYSEVQATITNDIISVRNPKGGRICAPSIQQIIFDEHCVNPDACIIETLQAASA